MKTLPVILVSAVLGGAVGVALAYTRHAAPVTVSQRGGTEAGPSRDLSTPKAVVDQAEHDFGVMQRGATRQHEFIVKNEGNSPLRLTAGETSCKCTKFEVAGGTVPPGGQVGVALEWVARSLPGPFRQTANLNTNDPLRPVLTLSVDGEVIEPGGLEPNSFTLGEMRTGESAAASVLFYSNDLQELQVQATGPSGEEVANLFDVRVTPVEKQDLPGPNVKSARRITLTAKPGLPVGQVMEWVTLTTNQPDSEKLEVPVFGRVVGDITVHGSGWSDEYDVLHLGMVPQDQGESRRLLLSVKGEHAADTRFEVASVDPPELQVEIGKTKRKNDEIYHTYFTIEVPPGTRPMVHLNNAQGDDGLVLLKTTHPEAKEMVLRVRFAVTQ